MTPEPPDLDSLRLPPDMRRSLSPKRRPPRHKPNQKFLRGPIPWAWLMAAARLRGRALHVALILWHHAGLKNHRTVSFCLRWATDFGMSRDTARRCLRNLVAAGLVTTNARRGRGLLVTLNDYPPEPSECT